MHEILRLSQWAIDLAGGDASMGGEVATSTPLAFAIAFRGLARWCLGMSGWRDDFRHAIAMVGSAESVSHSGVLYYTRTMAMLHGVVLSDDTTVRAMAEILTRTEHSGEDVTYGLAKSNVAFALLHGADESQRPYALELLRQIRDLAVRRRYSRTAIPMVDTYLAHDRIRNGDLDAAIELARTAADEEMDCRGVIFASMATSVLVEALLRRGREEDLAEAQSAVNRLDAVETEPGLVLYDIWLAKMRAQLAQAQNDGAQYRDLRDRYRRMATELGFEGHMAWADAMA